MSTIEGNRAAAHIAPIQCLTPADASAAALSVRERRRALFFVEQPRPVAVAPTVKAPEPKVVPPKTDLLCLFSLLATLTANQAEENARKLSLGEIIKTVCKVLNIKKNDMLSGRRRKEIVVPRHIAIALCKALTTKSLPEIGYAFGDRDHTTILYATQKLAPVLADIEDAIYVAPLPYVVAIVAAAYDRIKPPAPVRR
jgi:hypothetical protein